MDYKEEFKELKYIPEKNRDKKFWKIYEDFLNQLHKNKPIFLCGLLSVIISEYQDSINEVKPNEDVKRTK